MQDRLGRPLKSLRISVTDRCNARCQYCMPEADYKWLPKDQILSFEELAALAEMTVSQGVTQIRVTGGEPLLRRELPRLIEMLAGLEGLEDLSLTTNGILLAPVAKELKRSGLHRLTISLDTLKADRYRALAGIDGLADALSGLHAAREAGFASVKLNTVVIRGVNDDELGDLLAFAKGEGIELRFIEYMDVGGATRWRSDRVVPAREIRSRLAKLLGPLAPLGGRGSSPSESFVLPDGQILGIIGSVSEPFCSSCDRGRITADGKLYTCLYGREGVDLGSLLRQENGLARAQAALKMAWAERRDQGAVERLGLPERGTFVSTSLLRKDPHLEMHTRGG